MTNNLIRRTLAPAMGLAVIVLTILAGCALVKSAPPPLNVRVLARPGTARRRIRRRSKRLDACAKEGGGEVAIPAGHFLIGSVEVKSNTTLRLSSGTVLMGSPDLDDYPVVKVRWEGKWVDGHRALIYAHDVRDVAVVGPGKISGSAALIGRQMPRRPVLIELISCQNVRFEGFSTEHRSMWSIHPTYCENVTAENLIIRSEGGNGDGIDVDSCRHVRISHCDIATGDDCIAIKSGRGMEGFRAARPTEDVSIEDCTMADSNFACVGIGSETSGGIRGVRMERCKFTGAKTFAVYIKSRPGRGAFIEDISGDNLDAACAPGGFLRINLMTSGIQDPEPVPGVDGIPTARNFRFTNVKVDCGALVDAGLISPVKPLDGFTLEHVRGLCTRGMTLHNMTNANLADIQVAGFAGA